MAVISPPWAIQASSHPATSARQSLQGLLGSPFSSFAGGVLPTTGGGGHGVIGATDLLVVQNGTPNMSVNVPGGLVAIRGTENQFQGVYGPCVNDGTVNLAIAAADPTNPRRDLVVAKIRDAQYSGASNDFSIVVVTGTPAASPADPTVPANAVVLARVAVAAAAASITNANITDLRTRASALGGTEPCFSTARPTGAALFAGLVIFEFDTGRYYQYTGTGWAYLFGGTDPTAARAYASGATVTSGAGAFVTVALAAESYDYGNNFAANAYVCPETCLYDVDFRSSAAVGAAERLIVSAFVGSTEKIRGLDNTSSGAINMGAGQADVIAGTAGDSITLRVLTNAARNTETGEAISYLGVRKHR